MFAPRFGFVRQQLARADKTFRQAVDAGVATGKQIALHPFIAGGFFEKDVREIAAVAILMTSSESELYASAEHEIGERFDGVGFRRPGARRSAGGQLLIGGETPGRSAERVGRRRSTPMTAALMRRRVAELRAALPAGIRLHYAMKANPMPALVGVMAQLVDGIDVASGRRAEGRARCRRRPREVSFAGPGKSDAELRRPSPPACWSMSSPTREVRAADALARAARRAGARCGAREPGLRAQVRRA